MNAKRVTHEFTQTNDAPPERVFPLLCPVREAEWVPGWQHKLIYSDSGVAEDGCVFTTPNEDGSETTWMCVEYAPPRRVGYVWIWPGVMTARLHIELMPNGTDKTNTRIRYTYTALSSKGEETLRRYDAAWFATKMQGWQKAISHYLRTGRKIDAGTWE